MGIFNLSDSNSRWTDDMSFSNDLLIFLKYAFLYALHTKLRNAFRANFQSFFNIPLLTYFVCCEGCLICIKPKFDEVDDITYFEVYFQSLRRTQLFNYASNIELHGHLYYRNSCWTDYMIFSNGSIIKLKKLPIRTSQQTKVRLSYKFQKLLSYSTLNLFKFVVDDYQCMYRTKTQ